MTAPTRIGVLGCAEIARRRMLPAMAASGRTEIAAIASRALHRAEEAARPYGCRAVHGYQALLEDPSVEAVYVPLPAALHAHWAGAALAAGKHVLAEKPLTTDREATAELIGSARARGLALMENVLFVHHSQHETVRTLLSDDVIGELRSFRAEFTVPRRADDDIRYSAELGGGALWDTAVYPLRAALHFLGPRLAVLGASLISGPGQEVDTAGAALLRTPDGVTAQLAFGLDHGYRSLYEITGTRGRITLDRAFTPPADHVPTLHVETSDGTEILELQPHDQVSATLAAFADAVRTGKGAGTAQSACLRQAALLEEIASSAARNQRPLIQES
ncbi:oxidoreductase [Streptomyces abyssalis]|uniref:Oxidoreductase n=1 Tax=Streptomyces abyssalis TaxID=933944 RepID=A0A1E7JGQ7_9ACTN|nr:Gfo/Idh/MocA family oxidoreductase [Streptomyces abyssalis]OEU85641.1 oxidoreductase [Streptomyces abyssalis]OEU92895.1 oxidoreductase [Streptomyces abyssalis]